MTIKIKSLLMGAVATSAMLGGLALTSSSAQALTLENGQILTVGGDINVARNASNQFTLSFADARINGGATTSPFQIGDSVNISTVSNLSVGVSTAFNSFIRGIGLTDGSEVDFNADRLTLSEGSRGNFFLDLNGNFSGANANNRVGFGSVTFQFATRGNPALAALISPNSSRGTDFSSEIAVVPTPAAVLPALFGMGTAAFRKKKREGEDELVSVGAEEV